MSISPPSPNQPEQNESKPYGRFLLTLIGFSIFYLILSFLCTFTVDPYGVWRNGGRRTNDRLIKAIKISRIQPKTILLGSSSTVIGLNPNHDDLQQEQPVYNLGLFGPNIYEIRRYFEHALSTNRLNKIILSLDFHAFSQYQTNAPGFSEARLENHFGDLKDYVSLYFSLDALNLVVDASKRGSYLKEDGSYLRPVDPQELKEIFESKLVEDFGNKALYGDFKLSESYMEDYRQIVARGKQKNIKISTFIPPIHATLFYGFVISERWDEYQSWLQNIVAVNPTWDFSGCNQITTQTINPEMDHFTDASHYTPEVGDILMRRILKTDANSTPSDFGTWVTSDNIDEHLKKIYDDCRLWQNQNPEIVKWVDDIKISASESLDQQDE